MGNGLVVAIPPAFFYKLVYMKRIWRLWANALGQKYGVNDNEADFVALIRTLIVIVGLTVNIMIGIGIVKHWHDADQPQPIIIYNNGDTNLHQK